ncbi:MAG: glutamate synthase subunit alpha, partial [Ilumatobacteraceae bacterium]|nr:glutamate synthase subunit alpha [Ilumatobacteraceae bacterium]
MNHDLPSASGLYDPRFEHDSCGVSFVVHIKGVASHRIVQTGLGALCSMEHRGATGAEPETGDGAGILLQVPDKFLRKVAGVELPAAGAYGVGVAFLPADTMLAEQAKAAIANVLDEEGLVALGWREVPVEPSCLGASARRVMPSFSQLFVAAKNGAAGVELDRLLFVARKRIEHELADELHTYFPSLSSRTLIYKGMLTTPELG